MKITDLKCAVIGNNPVVRINTDEGIYGLGEVEASKSYLKPHVLFYKDRILGQDPTDVERVMLNIRRLGSFKPWGSAVSAIEMALWDIAGKAVGAPVYKLLGGKVRDRVRVYNGAVRFPMAPARSPAEGGHPPEDYADNMQRMIDAPQKFSIIKQGLAFHGGRITESPEHFYGTHQAGPFHANRGPLSERGLNYIVDCIRAMKEVCGDEVGLALDLGPGILVPDALPPSPSG